MSSAGSSCFLIGGQSRLIQCGNVLIEKGHNLLGVISSDLVVSSWAKEKNLRHISPDANYLSVMRQSPFDFLFSIDNLHIVPSEVLRLARKMNINFHDGPLPRYAGVNVTNWAVLNQEAIHGVTWHEISEQVDAGDILKQRVFPVSRYETALTLNAKCYEASIESFSELLDDLVVARVSPIRQDLRERTYFGRWKRPDGACTIDWKRPPEEIEALVRGLDRGPYENPLGLPKLYLGDQVVVVKEMVILDSKTLATPGTILLVSENELQVATGGRDVELRVFISYDGKSISPLSALESSGLGVGIQLPKLEARKLELVSRTHAELCRHEDFWAERLRKYSPLQVPFRKMRRSGGQRHYLEARFSLPEDAIPQVNTFTNPGDTVFAALMLYFSRISGDTVFNIEFQDEALRQRVFDVEAFFSTHVPFHMDVENRKGFRELCVEVSKQIESAKSHGSYARDLPLRDPSLRSALSDQVGRPVPVTVERVHQISDRRPNTDGNLVIMLPDDGKECAWWYDTEVFEGSSIARMQEQFAFLWNEIAGNADCPIGKLRILPDQEHHKILVEWNNTNVEFPQNAYLHELFETQAGRSPEAVAIEFDGNYLIYHQLNMQSNQLAHHLIGLGIGPGTLVGIMLGRSPEMVVSLLATLKAGAAYVPLPPEYPAARLAQMHFDAAPKVVLTNNDLRHCLPRTSTVLPLDEPNVMAALSNAATHNPSDAERTTKLLPDHAAYVIYTSGSTGAPKGAIIQQHQLSNYLHWAAQLYEAAHGEGAPVNTPLAFDATVTSLYLPLISGKRVILLPEDRQMEALADLLSSGAELSLVKLTPAHLEALEGLLGKKASQVRARIFVVGGEALKGHVAAFWKRNVPKLKMFNEYGPTETTVGCCVYEVPAQWDASKDVPIGRPAPNTQLYILDQYMQPVPIGSPGELHIGGAQVGRGYLNQPELTPERFISDPFLKSSAARLYKTGDLCRFLSDGNVEFLGRRDFQVKIRGFRVELGEIEAALKAQPGITQAVVVARENGSRGRQLVAYLVGENVATMDKVALRRRLSERLPEFMLPADFVVLDALPLTANGKVDRKSLPTPNNGFLLSSNAAYKPPDDDAEEKVAEIWRDVLGITQVSREANFFDLGGDSLNLITCWIKLQSAFGREIAMVDLFTHTTVRTLAQHMDNGRTHKDKGDQTSAGFMARKSAAQRRQRIRLDLLRDVRIENE